jgi:hypothetical protein
MNDGILAPASPLREAPRALVGTGQRRPIVIVLGMHRSGTSLCSHVLSALGVDMADKVAGPGAAAPVADNPKGHWERWEIVDFHDRILGLFNRGYFTPFHDFGFPVAWWADPRVAEVRREIAAFLEKRMGNGYFGFKDPRTVRLMPIWHQIVNELKLAAKIVYCLRNPAHVALSLYARDRLDVEIGEYRWLAYNVDFFHYTKASGICTIEYEAWFDDPASNLTKLRNFLDLPEYHRDFDMDLAISGIVDNQLRHDEPRIGEAGQPLIRSVYKLARRADHDPAARDQVQNIAAQFLTFQQLQRVFQREFEQTVALAATVPALEQDAAALRDALRAREAALQVAQTELATREAALRVAEEEAAYLRVAVGESEAAVRDAGGRAGAAEARLGEALAEIEGHRARLAEVERERDDRAAALEAARTELASVHAAFGERDAALAAAGERAGAAEARLAEALAETEGQRSRLAEVERERDDRAAIWTQLEGLQNAVALAETDARERAAVVTAMQGEIVEVHDALIKAEERAEERAAAAVAMQSALIIAREVGRAAIGALAADDPAMVHCDEPIGWWQAIKRRFGFAGAA